jgi:hypothetical protein
MTGELQVYNLVQNLTISNQCLQAVLYFQMHYLAQLWSFLFLVVMIWVFYNFIKEEIEIYSMAPILQ